MKPSICTSAGEWAETFRREAFNARLPISGMIELTGRCNLRCLHCYLGPQEEQKKNRHREMSTSTVIGIIDEITEAGCLYLVLTGGDPMLRKDFPEIYRHARLNGLIVTVMCDGILITEEIIELFREYPPHTVEISLYGATPETYETITRVPNSFPRFLQGVHRLAEADIPFTMKTVLMTLNKHEIEAMRSLAGDLGSEGFRIDSAIFPCLPDGERSPLDLRVDPEEAVRLELSDAETRDGLRKYLDKAGSDTDLDDRLYVCSAGMTHFFIDSSGMISPCLMTGNYRYQLGNEHSFSEVWGSELQEIHQQKAGGDYPCNHCEIKAICSTCPAFNYQENGCEEKVSEYICRMAHIRWKAVQSPLILPRIETRKMQQ